MTMDPAEHKALLTQILESGGDQGRISDLLTQLSDDYGEIYTRAQSLESENTSLRDTNMRLFLKVGTPQAQPEPDEPEKPALRFEELFDENGKLK